MAMNYTRLALLASLSFLGACAVVPNGPSVMALPGTGKTFDQFRADDGSCRQFAFQQVGGVTANQAATGSRLAIIDRRVPCADSAGGAGAIARRHDRARSFVPRLRQRAEIPLAETMMSAALHDLEENLAGAAFDERLKKQQGHAVVADFAVHQNAVATQPVDVEPVARQTRIDLFV